MIERIDHVSIAVKDMDRAVRFFTEIFGARPGVGETDPQMKYTWQVYSLGDLSRLELLHPTGQGSFLDNFFKKNAAGGVHHVTLQTPDIREAAKKLERAKIPFFGFNDKSDGWKELFIHPKDAFGVLIQIAEFDPDHYLDDSVKFPPGEKWAVENRDGKIRLTTRHPGGGKAALDLSREEVAALVEDLKKAAGDL